MILTVLWNKIAKITGKFERGHFSKFVTDAVGALTNQDYLGKLKNNLMAGGVGKIYIYEKKKITSWLATVCYTVDNKKFNNIHLLNSFMVENVC